MPWPFLRTTNAMVSQIISVHMCEAGGLAVDQKINIDAAPPLQFVFNPEGSDTYGHTLTKNNESRR